MVNIFNYEYFIGLGGFSSFELLLFSLIFLSIGSFASSSIFRLSPNSLNEQTNTNLLFPRSFCPDCKTSIKLIYLIPLVGYIIQKGKCNSCKKEISSLYPLTEIFFLFSGLVALKIFGLGIFLYFSILLIYLFYVLFYLDFKFYYLPLSLNLLLVITGFVSNIFFNVFINDTAYIFNLSSITFTAYGFLIGYSSLWFINFIFRIIYKRDGIGGGDFILFGGIGSIFGPISLGLILFLGAFIGCILFLIFNNKFKNEIPLGSSLILGSVFYFFIKKYELLSNFLVI
ncbi:MAG: prepilin peptidase [Gammaproteobacteria bacterium]|nr:prepilin peptidase [Gammaproteobacteria bacterium]